MVENVIQIKSGIAINIDVSVKIWKNITCAKKDYIRNPATCSCKNGIYIGSIIVNSVITGDNIIKEGKTIQINFDEEKVAFKNEKLYILLTF